MYVGGDTVRGLPGLGTRPCPQGSMQVPGLFLPSSSLLHPGEMEPAFLSHPVPSPLQVLLPKKGLEGAQLLEVVK